MGTATAVLTGLNVYPLKSGGGVPLRTIELLTVGSAHLEVVGIAPTACASTRQ
ncbi:hypothetical protein ACFQ07_27175 [Actinomadura adrarensis]|uniref:MOSC domain-containing protein n=1 Tax=Actinomadura adrarensis TaxID=1819600 RepID=A0ABW3CN36_9ACTN